MYKSKTEAILLPLYKARRVTFLGHKVETVCWGASNIRAFPTNEINPLVSWKQRSMLFNIYIIFEFLIRVYKFWIYIQYLPGKHFLNKVIFTSICNSLSDKMRDKPFSIWNWKQNVVRQKVAYVKGFLQIQ